MTGRSIVSQVAACQFDRPIDPTTKKAFSGKLGGWVAFVTLDPSQSSWIGEDRSGVSISLVRFTSKSPDVRNSFT